MSALRLLLVSIAILTTACAGSSSPAATRIEAYNAPLPIQPGWLAARQTADSIAYLRIPYLPGLISAPKDNALGTFLGSKTHVEWLASMLAGVDRNILGQRGLDHPVVQWLIRYQRSPFEIMVGPIPGATMKAPAALAVVTTNMTDPAVAETAINALLASAEGGVALAGGLDANGTAALTNTPSPAVASFDAASGRVFLLVGAGATIERMNVARATLESPVADAPMYRLESQIDASRHGFFSWMSVRNALALGQAFIPADVFATMRELGLEDADAWAMGYGVSRGKTRLSLLAEVPSDGGYRDLIPVPANPMGLRVTEPPRFVLTLSVPTLQELIDILVATAEGDTEADVRANIAEYSEKLDVDLEAAYGLLAGELTYVQEAVGGYWALHQSEPAAFNRVIAAIGERYNTPLRSRRVAGTEIWYWKFPTLNDMVDGKLTEDPQLKRDVTVWELTKLYASLGTHLFWVRDGDYIVLAESPQVLMDRARRGATVSVGEWLAETQGQDFSEASLAVSASAEGLPRFAHQTYLTLAPTLSDLAGVELDIWDLPTADDLGLPERGTLGFSVITGDGLLGAELTMEHSLLDTFASGSGSLSTIAAVGVLAAVAIPAYQDYTIRAQVSEGLILGTQAKTEIAEFHAANGRLPNRSEAPQFSRDMLGKYASSIFWDADAEAIVILMDGPQANQRLSGEALLMRAVPTGDGIVWECSSEMPQRFLPSACRLPETFWPE